MQRIRKNNSKKFRRSQLIIVGFLLIFIGIFLISAKYVYNYFSDKEEDLKIEEFYKLQEEIKEDNKNNETLTEKKQQKYTNLKTDYVAVIKIPKINLEKGLCEKGSYCNNVNRNIQILDDSTYPNIENGNFILAGHSGNVRTAYFKKLDKLSLSDEVSIFFGGQEYKYKIVDIYDIENTGTAKIVRSNKKTTLTLITCRRNTNKQIIIICELIEIV